jgi:ParB family chromosome partitioning protein
MNIEINKIILNPEQPRVLFDENELQGLAQSIKENGLIQPITVEKIEDDLYRLIDGERRLRAHKYLGLETIEAFVKPTNGKGQNYLLVDALVANLQRSDLNPIEEAEAFKKLRETGLTVEKTSDMLGISTAVIIERMKLLTLDEPIQEIYKQRKLPIGVGIVKAFMDIQDPEKRIKIANSLAMKGASIKTILGVCKRISNGQNEYCHLVGKEGIPSIEIAKRKTGKQNDIFSVIKGIPPWPKVERTAKKACNSCMFNDIASSSTCKDCPLVEFLVDLIREG